MRITAARPTGALALVAAAALALTGCAAGTPAATETPAETAKTVTVEANNGSFTVPVNPERVVVLDNTAFETISEFGITPVAVPKPLVVSVWPQYDKPEILDVGSHREPKLEAVDEAKPDLIIGGYRFGDYTDELSKIATTIDIAPDSEDHVAGLKKQTEILGEIFDKQDEAAAIIKRYDDAVAEAKTAAEGKGSVLALLTSGGKVLADPPGGRLGAIYSTLDLTPALERAAENAGHGDDISLETIAQADPEWFVVLDRDAGTSANSSEAFTPAKELIADAEALKNTVAIKDGNIVYLNPNFYLTEGIQAYTEVYEALAKAFSA